MKLDDDVKMISAEAPVLFAKAAEMFITELTMRAWIHTEDNKRRTLQVRKEGYRVSHQVSEQMGHSVSHQVSDQMGYWVSHLVKTLGLDLPLSWNKQNIRHPNLVVLGPDGTTLKVLLCP